MLKGMPVCLQNRNYGKFNSPTLPMHKHECFKRYCAFCQKNREAGHYCYMRPLQNELPKSENVLFVFYDFETTQHTKLTASATVHILNLVFIQQFCSLCEKPDIDVHCERCGTRRHSFCEDPVGDLLAYLCKQRQWCKKVVAIAHSARGMDAHFILDRALLLKWTPKLILNGQNVYMTLHHITFLDSISFLPMALRKLPEAFGISASKSWYPHYFNTKSNWDYVGPIPGIEHYGVEQMNESEGEEFMAWHETQKDIVFNNRQVLTQYCKDEVTVLRQACQLFRRDFFQVGIVDVFLESCTIASACKKCSASIS